MEAALPPTLCLLQAKLSKPASFLGDNPHMPTLIASPALFLPTALRVMSHGNRRGPSQRNTVSGRSPMEDKGGTDGESSSQKDLISLFKKIKTEISQGQSKSAKARVPKPAKDDSAIESLLEVFQQPDRTKGNPSRKDKDRVYSQNRRIPKKPDEKPDDQPAADNKLSRAPSNFVKRSPIPSPTPVRSIHPEATGVESVKLGFFKESMQIGHLKLPELKELAKTRGIKGYSKLKKKELVELLSPPGNVRRVGGL